MEAIRQKILNSALELLDKRGVKFRIDDIVEMLSISKKTVYKYFETKEEIIDSIIDYLYNMCKDRLGEIIEAKISLSDKIKELLYSYPSLYRITNKTITGKFKISQKNIANVYGLGREIKAVILLYYDEAVKKGELRGIKSETFITLFEGLFEKTVASDDREGIVRTVVEVFFNGLKLK